MTYTPDWTADDNNEVLTPSQAWLNLAEYDEVKEEQEEESEYLTDDEDK